jgi:hypothetical protein
MSLIKDLIGVLTLGVFLVTAPRTYAQEYFVRLTVTGIGTCTENEYRHPATIEWNVPPGTILNVTTRVDGIIVLQASAPSTLVGSGIDSSSLNANAYITAPGLNYSVVDFVEFTTTELGVFSRSILTGTCANGVFTASIVNETVSGGSSSLSSTRFTGPTIPSGYAQSVITCDVAVFDAPAGSPVGNNRIAAGQTWHVAPESVTAPDGSLWRQVFVGGFQNPYIPDRCVQ